MNAGIKVILKQHCVENHEAEAFAKLGLDPILAGNIQCRKLGSKHVNLRAQDKYRDTLVLS